MPHPVPALLDLDELARLVANRLGADLTRQFPPRPPMPTLAEYLPRVVAAAGPGARKAYGSYWNRS